MSGFGQPIHVVGVEFPTVHAARQAAQVQHRPAECNVWQDGQFVVCVGERYNTVHQVAGLVLAQDGGTEWDVPVTIVGEVRARRIRARLDRAP